MNSRVVMPFIRRESSTAPCMISRTPNPSMMLISLTTPSPEELSWVFSTSVDMPNSRCRNVRSTEMSTMRNSLIRLNFWLSTPVLIDSSWSVNV